METKSAVANVRPENASATAEAADAFPYVYRWDRKGRKGQRCAVVTRSHAQNSCHLRFEDGFEMVTSRNSILRAAHMKNSVSVARKAGAVKYPSLPDSAVEGATAQAAASISALSHNNAFGRKTHSSPPLRKEQK